MYVYLKLGESVKCVSGVTLHDAYCPMVGEVGEEYQLEPAIWFKTLIIDSILIDCNQRVVRWGRANITESSVHNDLSGKFQDTSIITEPDNVVNLKSLNLRRTVFEDGDCYDFEPNADELFDSASRLVDSFVTQQIGDIKFKTEILRLLHCFVLPSLKLTRDDVHPLQNALQFTEKKLQTLENEVLSKDKGNVITENSLRKQRNRLVNNENFHRESYVKSCNFEFLHIFLKHIEKDIEECNERLQTIQGVVNLLRNSTKEEEKRKLYQSREERDKIHTDLQKLQLIRENIKNVTVRSQLKNCKSQKVKQVPNVFHEIYIEICNRLQGQKDAIHKLCLRKVKISSVREAIVMTLDELKFESSTYGWEVNTVGTESATNILSNLGIPESWRSLEEQIFHLLTNPEILPHARFEWFCNSLHQKIEGSLQEAEFFMSSPVSPESVVSGNNQGIDSSDDFVDIEFTDVLNATSAASKERRSRNIRTLSETSIRSTGAENDVSTLPLRSLLDVIKNEIKEHIQEMCQILLNLMPEYAKVHGNAISSKIWVCYEKHLYHRIIDEIQDLYARAFGKVSAAIRTKLAHLSFSELGIDETWLFRMDQNQDSANVNEEDEENTDVKQPLEDEDDFEHVSRQSPHSSSTSTTLSLEKLSLGELYEYADKECSNLQEFLECSVAVDPFDHEPKTEPNGARGITLPNGPPPYDQACARSDCPPAYGDPGKSLALTGSELSYSRTEQDIQSIIKWFEPVLKNISDSLECKTILTKLKQITKAFRFMGKQVSVMKKNSDSSSKDGYMACCDDILTVTIVVLKFLDDKIFQNFYSQMNMIIDLMPPFMNGSVHDCSLTNFCCAFQYLMDRQVIRQSRDITN